jgi:hypothetical protein
LSDLESDVAINGLHESFLKGQLKLDMIGFIRFSGNVGEANSLPSREFCFIIFASRKNQTLNSENIY